MLDTTRHASVTSEVTLAPGVALARPRAHEATGPARAVFALLAAARLTGPVLWLTPRRSAERPFGDGLSAFLDPSRLVLARTRKPIDSLWAAEEALRSGQVPLVVADLPDPPNLTSVRRLHLAAESGARLRWSEDPREAVRGADFVYTDVWTSMGQEDEQALRRRVFAAYQVNAELLREAPDAWILHCLPAHRGEEITDEVLDGERSIVFDQAENRLHAQKAILEQLLGPRG